MTQHAQNLFGTDGIRNTIGSSPFTNKELHALGGAIGAWLSQRYPTSPFILLAHDTRVSCSWVKAALQTGLLMHPVRIFDAEVLPTPAVSKLLQTLKSQGMPISVGIIISASHNPFHDNGIKIVTVDGKLSQNDELALSKLYYEQFTDCCASHMHGHPRGIAQSLVAIQEGYIHAIEKFFPEKFLEGKKILLDGANGAASWLAPKIFQRLGASVMTINNSPSGMNINDKCGALHPEQLQGAVLLHKADIGFAFDGDGDRVIAVASNGEVKNGDDLMAILTQHPTYNQKRIVGTIMANAGFETYLKGQGKELMRTPVGDKYVAEAMAAQSITLGGEQSGHIILGDYLNTGDGIFAALRVCQTLIHINDWSLNTFTKYPQASTNISVQDKKDLTITPLADIIAATKAQLPEGRIVVRYSGTEPLLRIMAEAPSQEEAQQVVNSLSQQLGAQLNSQRMHHDV